MNVTNRTVTARDGARLALRLVGVDGADRLAVFVHGGSQTSRRYLPLAKELAAAGTGVVLLDLRGHGESDGPRGDVAYVGQLEDDLEDVLRDVRATWPGRPIFVGGHSSGALVVLRHTGAYPQTDVAGYLILSPTMPSAPEASRYDSPILRLRHRLLHWRAKERRPMPPKARLVMPRLDLAGFLLALILPSRRHRDVLTFPGVPKLAALEKKPLDYTYRLMASIACNDLRDRLAALSRPVCVVIGAADEATDPVAFRAMCDWELPRAVPTVFVEVASANHLSVIAAAGPTFARFTRASEHVFVPAPAPTWMDLTPIAELLLHGATSPAGGIIAPEADIEDPVTLFRAAPTAALRLGRPLAHPSEAVSTTPVVVVDAATRRARMERRAALFRELEFLLTPAFRAWLAQFDRAASLDRLAADPTAIHGISAPLPRPGASFCDLHDEAQRQVWYVRPDSPINRLFRLSPWNFLRLRRLARTSDEMRALIDSVMLIVATTAFLGRQLAQTPSPRRQDLA